MENTRNYRKKLKPGRSRRLRISFKKIYLFVIFIAVPLVLKPQVKDAINSFVTDSVFRNASVSVCIRDVSTGEILAAYNKDMALYCASLMKLVTTGSAIELLGPDYRYHTKVGYTGNLQRDTLYGNIYIIGGGDPALGSKYFTGHYKDFISKWALSIKDKGIKEIKGQVIADASLFAYHPVAPGWSWNDIGNYYGAGVHGLSVCDNTYRITYKTGTKGTAAELLSVEPPVPGLKIINNLTAEGTTDQGYVYLPPYAVKAVVRGTIPVNKNRFSLKASVPDPPVLAASMLDEALRSYGIKTASPPVTARDLYPDNRAETVNIEYCYEELSPPLSEIVRVTNNESVNLFAETIAWTLDSYDGNKEQLYLAGGLDVIRKFLDSHLPCQSGIYMTDGSGLSRSNAISSSFISSFLSWMVTRSAYSDLYYNSLPGPGEGTLNGYFTSPELENSLRAKSGTSTRARNYAGYLTTHKGRMLSFGILTNNFDCTPSEVTKRIESLLLIVYSLL